MIRQAMEFIAELVDNSQKTDFISIDDVKYWTDTKEPIKKFQREVISCSQLKSVATMVKFQVDRGNQVIVIISLPFVEVYTLEDYPNDYELVLQCCLDKGYELSEVEKYLEDSIGIQIQTGAAYVYA